MAINLSRNILVAAVLQIFASTCTASTPEIATSAVASLPAPATVLTISTAGNLPVTPAPAPDQWCLCELTIEDAVFISQYDPQ